VPLAPPAAWIRKALCPTAASAHAHLRYVSTSRRYGSTASVRPPLASPPPKSLCALGKGQAEEVERGFRVDAVVAQVLGDGVMTGTAQQRERRPPPPCP